MRISLPLVAFFVLCLSSCNGDDSNSQKEPDSKVIDSVNTIAGSMKIVRVGRGADRVHTIQIAGNPVSTIPGLLTVDIASSYPKPPRTQLVLLALNSGGTACPILFRIVKINKNSKASISDEFGTCSETVHTKYSLGFWIVTVEGYKFNSKKTWKYKIESGKLKDN